MARIGFTSIWFNRGQSEITRTLMCAVEELGHTPYLFGREGSVYGQPMRETTGRWVVPNRTDYPRYEIAPSDLRAWATFHRLSAVVFNEEHQHDLAMTLRGSGIRTIHYVDWLGAAWRPFLRFYDALWTATHRTEQILVDWKKAEQTHYIGWGVQPEMFAACATLTPISTYFHSAGWLGINCRKGTDTVLQAMRAFEMENEPPDCYIHCQLPMDAAKRVIGWEGDFPPYIIWNDQTVPPPGLYHFGRVVIQPSKLEGLGLTIVEAMAAGRPVITTDAAPMNEMVTPETGWLVPVERWMDRGDGICFPEVYASTTALAKAMQEARAASDTLISEKARLTLARARQIFDWETFKARVGAGLERIGIG